MCSIDSCLSELICNGRNQPSIRKRRKFIAIRHSLLFCSLHAINMYWYDLNCEMKCSWEPIKIYVPHILQPSIQFSALLDTTKCDKIKMSGESRKFNSYFSKNILFENSQRLRSTKVATSMNNVKLTISKPNAVTDDAFAATKWQRSRREMEIMNAKVCLSNNRIFRWKVRVGGPSGNLCACNFTGFRKRGRLSCVLTRLHADTHSAHVNFHKPPPLYAEPACVCL